jgi:hypothetical protein
MAGENFYLRFENDPTAENIPMGSEFIGWDNAKLMMKQRDGGFARDESFDASEAEYVPGRGHFLDKMLQTFDEHGFEMKVKQGVVSEDRTIEYDIDGGGEKTNELASFTAPLIQGGKLQLLKDRFETKINLFSSRTLDGDLIAPLVPENVLYYSYPTVDISKWEQSEPLVSRAGGSRYVSFFQSIKQSDIADTLTPFFYTSGLGNQVTAVNTFKYIRAKDNLKDIQIKVDLDIDFIYRTIAGSPSDSAYIELRWFIFDEPYTNAQPGSQFGTAYTKTITGTASQDFHLPNTLTFNIPAIGRNQCLSLFWALDWDNSHLPDDGCSNSDVFNPQQSCGNPSTGTFWRFNDTKMQITATRESYNTVVPMLRLYDIIKYWVKSASGLDIDAPRFAPGGEFYSIRNANGNLFRLKKNEPFYITGKMIMDSIGSQFLADYESNWGDASIFFGVFEDFYQDVEIALFKSNQFKEFSKTMNPRFMVNDVGVKFSKYESQRENTAQNTIDEVHGEYEGLMPNKKAKNTYSRTIEWAMSARYLERNRRAAIEETSSTATNDDDTLFAIDVNDQGASGTNAIPFTEQSYLQHRYTESTNKLSLKNDGSFSWLSLGIGTIQPFVITTNPTQKNQGIYSVYSVSDSELILIPGNGSNPTDGNDGERNTRYTYLIDTSTITGTTWRNEGLTVQGLSNSDKYPNLRFSLGQSIDKYHKRYLSTMLYYRSDEYLRTTFYKNNPNAVINGIREGGEIRSAYPEGSIGGVTPILTPVLYQGITFVGDDITLATWDKLVEKIRTIRGYIRFVDNRGVVRKFYPKIGGWSVKDEAIVFDEGEEKFEPYIINISRADQEYININNEYQVTQLRYEKTGEAGLEYRIMDRENQLLYNPIWYKRIYVNGQEPSSQNELEQWLTSL